MAVNKKETLIADSLSAIMEDVKLPSSGNNFDFYGRNFSENNKKERVVSEIRADVGKIQKLFEKVFYPKRVQGIEDYTLSTARRAAKLKEDGRSGFANVKQPIIRTFVDRLLKGIIKANFSVKVNPVSSEYKNQVEAVQHAINRCFATSKAKSKIQKIAASAILNGNGFCKASFSTPKEKRGNIENPESRSYVKIDSDYARFDWVSEFDLFYEPTEPLNGAQRFVINRQIKPLKSILTMCQKMDKTISAEHLLHVMSKPRPFSNKDYNLVRLMKYYDDACNTISGFDLDSTYKIAYNNDKVEYLEIWTPDTLSVCINGYIVADTKNPLKDRKKWHPYFSAHYTENPGVAVSEGVGILLGDIQKAYDALFNLLMDQATMTASPMISLSPGQQMLREESDTEFKRKPWGIVMNGGPGSMSFLTPPSVDAGSITFLNKLLEMAQFNVAPATYADYNTQSRSAQDSMLRFEGLADTVALFVDSMSSMLNEVAQAWLLDMQKKMPEFFQLPIFAKNGTIKEWKNIKRSDLEGKFIFEWASESIRDVNTIIEKKQLPELLQFVQAFSTDSTGNQIVDRRKMLEYVCNLYNVEPEVILTESQVSKKIEGAAVKQEQLNQKIGRMQATFQRDMQEEQAEYQAKIQAQQAAQQIPQQGAEIIPDLQDVAQANPEIAAQLAQAEQQQAETPDVLNNFNYN